MYSKTEQWLNNLVEEFLSDIPGFGERNWFGSSKSALNNMTELDNKELIISLPLILIFLIMLTFSLTYPHLLIPGVIYFLLILTGLFFWDSGKAGTSYFGFGERYELWTYVKVGLLTALLWFGASVLLGKITNQQISPVMQQITISEIMPSLLLVIASSIITIFAVSYAEGSLFASGLIPTFTKNIGIIPTILICVLLAGILHYIALGANPFTILLTIFRGFLVYPLVLYYQSKTVELSSHIFANALTTLYLILT